MVQVDHYDRAILHYLMMAGGRATAGRISEHVRMSWNTVDAHLKKLRRMGFVGATRQGRVTYWQLK